MAARKPTVRKLSAKDRLLKAAAHQFARHGFEGTTLRSIADDARVTFQLIKYHFGSKDELWQAVVNSLYDDVAKNAMSAVYTFDRSRNLEDQFREHMVAIFAYWRDNPELRQILMQEGLADSGRDAPFEGPLLMARRLTLSYVERVQELGVATRFTSQEVMTILDAFLTSLAAGDHEHIHEGPDSGRERWRTLAIFVANILLYGAGNAKGRSG